MKTRTIKARDSKFNDWKPVIDPAAVLRAARKRLGPPVITRRPDATVYTFWHDVFDALTVVIGKAALS